MKKLLLWLLLCQWTLTISGQDNLVAGQWRAHLPYKTSVDVTQNQDYVFYATPHGIFSIGKKTGELNLMSKVDGLSDVDVQHIDYDKNNHQLIVVYKNSNIDIIQKDGTITNVPDILNNRAITGSKEIRSVHVRDGKHAYIATTFGIVEFRLDKLEFGSTIFTPFGVNDISSNGQTLYAATEDGLYTVKDDSSTNISDFRQWRKYSNGGNLAGVYPCEKVAIYNDGLYFTVGGKLYNTPLGKWDAKAVDQKELEGYKVAFFSQDQENLIIGLVQSDPFSKIAVVKKDGTWIEGGANCINRLMYGIEDETGKMWYADDYRGIRSTIDYTSGCDMLTINGPLTSDGSDIDVVDGVLYVASGGASETYTILSNRSGFFILKDGQWSNYNDQNVKTIKDNDFANIFMIAKDPNSPKVYLGSYYHGLISYNTETKEELYFSAENSGIQHPAGESDGERISGLTFDKAGNLWINSIYAERPLTVYTKDGKWYNYTYSGSKSLARCEVDAQGLVWSVVTSGARGVLVYDTNNTLDNTSDDVSKILNKSNSNFDIKTSTINCIRRDLNGDMWVGTDAGPVVFRSGKSIFENIKQGRRLKVVQNGDVGYLLSTQDIRAIEVDGANRKWIGTRNGIFVMSAAGDEQVAYFNIDNSPLLDNTILDMTYDGDSGIMYISTLKGIVSYKTATTAGSRRHSASSIYAYPNPVRPDYMGNIYVRGLARDARVKITDLEGKLVRETTALGGTATWDGKDYNGRRAAPGVYLVFSTTKVSEKSDNYVTKIMVVE